MKDRENNLEKEPSFTKSQFGDLAVPDGYFESVQQRLKVIPAQQKPKHKSKAKVFYLLGAIAVAASLLWAVFTWINSTESEMDTPQFTELEVEDLWLVYENDYSFDEYSLTEELYSVDFETPMNDEDLLNEDAVYEYLLSQDYTELQLIETF